MTNQRTVLITGCSQGGLGDALAQAFHASPGIRVIATARNLSKVTHMESLGIETLQLDVVSQQSIEDCVAKVSEMTGGRLDLLLNNSGAGYSMPLSDSSLEAARQLFDLNLWAVFTVSQAFLPLLLRSTNGMIVNNTSIVSVIPSPFQGIYAASKAAAASLTATLRLELQPFGITVIDLKTGAVKSNIFQNQAAASPTKLPANSIYAPGRAIVERYLTGKEVESRMVDADVWAKTVVGDLLKTSPSPVIWRGGSAMLVRVAVGFFPQWMRDMLIKDALGINALEKTLKEQKRQKQS